MGYKCAGCEGYIALVNFKKGGGDAPATSRIDAITPCGRRINISSSETTLAATSQTRASDLEVTVTGGEGEHCNGYCSIGVGGFNNTETLSLNALLQVAIERGIELV